MDEKDSKPTSQQRVEQCLAETKHKLSVACIRSRIARGWTNERIIATNVGVKHKPPMSHPFKRRTFNRVAIQKGWNDESPTEDET